MAHDVAAVAARAEHLADLRVIDRTVGRVIDQVLLGDIGDVVALRVLREEVVERLIALRTSVLGYGIVPFLGIRELRVDVEHDAAEVEMPVLHHGADREFGLNDLHSSARFWRGSLLA